MINRDKLHSDFTEIIGMCLHMAESNSNSYEGWRDRYMGRQPEGLPFGMIKVDFFRNRVDYCVAMLMAAIDEVEQ